MAGKINLLTSKEKSFKVDGKQFSFYEKQIEKANRNFTYIEISRIEKFNIQINFSTISCLS